MTVHSLQANEYYICLQLNMHSCIYHITEIYGIFYYFSSYKTKNFMKKIVQLFLNCYKQTDKHGDGNRPICVIFSCEHNLKLITSITT
jgi:hypothetical protein